MLNFTGSLYGRDQHHVFTKIPRGFVEVDPRMEVFLWWNDADVRLVRTGGTDAKPLFSVITPVGVKNV